MGTTSFESPPAADSVPASVVHSVDPMTILWRHFVTQWIILGLFSLLLGLILLSSLINERTELLNVNGERLSIGARYLAQVVERRLALTNVGLSDLRDNLAHLDIEGAKESHTLLYLQAIEHVADGVRAFGILDAQGVTKASSLPQLVGMNFRQREYFQTVLRQPDAQTLYVSEPFKTLLGVHSMNLTRAYFDARGQFSGILTATLEPKDFKSVLESLRHTPDVAAGLVHGSGKVVFYAATPEILPGTDVSAPDTLFSRHLQSGQERSLFTGFLTIPGNQRLAATHTIKPVELSMNVPLVAIVSQEISGILAPWQSACWKVASLFALLVSLSVLSLYAYQRHQRKLHLLDMRSEQALRNAQRLTQQFIDHLPGTAYVKDENLRVLMASQGFQTILGIDPASMIGKSNEELFPGDFGKKLDADDRRIFDAGQGTVIEETWDNRYFESSKFVIDGGVGNRLLGGITLEVTHRHRSFERQETLLRINELGSTLPEKDFLRQGLEFAESLTGSQIGFLHFFNADQESIELVTWTPGALEGCTVAYESHYPMSSAGIWADCLRDKKIVVCNDYPGYLAKKGLPPGHVPLQRLISVPVIEDDKVRVILGVGNKSTDYDDFDCASLQLIGNDLWRMVRRMRAENAVLEQMHELKALNTKLEDAQNQLLQSEKMASIGQLAAGVAHELNNPIGFVNSNLGSLAEYIKDFMSITAAYAEVESRLGPTMPGVFEQAHRLKKELDYDFMVKDAPNLLAESRDGLERVSKIVRDLKDFSRVGEVEWQWADLHKGLESTINIVWNEIKYKTELVRDYGELPKVYCIPSQLNQVFMNLLTNAAQAIPEHGVVVLRSGREADKVWIEVEDNGNGIAPEHLKRIFEPFFTTKPVGKGTGLGLSLAWGIMQRHQGSITVKSVLGKGSFRISLPISPPPPESEDKTTC